MRYTTEQIAELFPDLRSIRDSGLRDKVAAVWLSRSTVGGRGGAMLDRAWPRSHVFGRQPNPARKG